MWTSCTMMASSVTPLAAKEGEEVDGVVEAGGAAICVWGLPRAKLCKTSLHSSGVNGTHIQEIGRLRIGDRKVAKESRDS